MLTCGKPANQSALTAIPQRSMIEVQVETRIEEQAERSPVLMAKARIEMQRRQQVKRTESLRCPHCRQFTTQAMSFFLHVLDFSQFCAEGDLKALIKFITNEEGPECLEMTDDNGLTPLHYSTQNGQEMLVKETVKRGGKHLIEKRTKVQEEPTPIHLAAKRGHVSVVNLLLDIGGDRFLTIQDKYGRTIVGVAAEEGQLAVLRAIVERKGVDFILSLESNGLTIFHDAAFGGHVSVLQQLVDWTGTPMALESFNQYGLTPLHMSASGNRVEAIEYLLKEGGVTLLQKTNTLGNTPMHLACLQGNREAVMCMINKEGGRELLRKTNRRGKTPIDLAKWRGHEDLTTELERTG
ncbi:unnamed protein product [Vitrella brassicaformis CCMP3155]|uniref:Uncharacterized protein n=1 Tax=Vitrella brassicaformis (strain CCMP3155) TaxID=1169540 RepID=A0A0G4EJI6_VITBC|nr:unnamed protein product [Vitrella brassicaformis CCMP3155]|eukprot:CEL96916.1 unnamed protein product [Vitrella brassicaformis CCMP3155]